jgi:hypothetical protein
LQEKKREALPEGVWSCIMRFRKGFPEDAGAEVLDAAQNPPFLGVIRKEGCKKIKYIKINIYIYF